MAYIAIKPVAAAAIEMVVLSVILESIAASAL